VRAGGREDGADHDPQVPFERIPDHDFRPDRLLAPAIDIRGEQGDILGAKLGFKKPFNLSNR
jgi:hypothetical protein